MQDARRRPTEGLGKDGAPLCAPLDGSSLRAWLAEQYRLARTPGFLEATLAALRAQAGPGGQREVLLEELRALTAPTLIVWGTRDRVFPRRHAEDAAARLREVRPVFIPDCGHLPHIEPPGRFAEVLGRFLDKARNR